MLANPMVANPMMVMPLAMYRYWAGVLYRSTKAADAAIDSAKSTRAAAVNGRKPTKRFARRPRYVSARVRRARQNAR
jgi:hypothetical protein